MDHLSRWMQFDLIVTWMKNFDLKTGQGWRSVWRQGREPRGHWSWRQTGSFSFNFAGNRIFLFALTAKKSSAEGKIWCFSTIC